MARAPRTPASPHDAASAETYEEARDAHGQPVARCVALCRVAYGVGDGTVVTYEPGAAIPDEHASGMVEGVHYRRE